MDFVTFNALANAEIYFSAPYLFTVIHANLPPLLFLPLQLPLSHTIALRSSGICTRYISFFYFYFYLLSANYYYYYNQTTASGTCTENDNATTESRQRTHTTTTIENEKNDDERLPHLQHHQEHQLERGLDWRHKVSSKFLLSFSSFTNYCCSQTLHWHKLNADFGCLLRMWKNLKTMTEANKPPGDRVRLGY